MLNENKNAVPLKKRNDMSQGYAAQGSQKVDQTKKPNTREHTIVSIVQAPPGEWEACFREDDGSLSADKDILGWALVESITIDRDTNAPVRASWNTPSRTLVPLVGYDNITTDVYDEVSPACEASNYVGIRRVGTASAVKAV